MFKAIYIFILIVFIKQVSFALPTNIDNHIKVDQFGYRCNDQKIAVISNPQTGFNAASVFNPSTAANQYQVRKWDSDEVVFTGTLSAWNGGAIHAQSGDKVWWFDFSSVTNSGNYYVYDIANNAASYQFDIGDNVYQNVIKQAVRSFYYQRCGVAKLATHAGAGWADGACHIGAQQDTDCRLYNNTNVATSKNLSGGWHDAGDHNKYVNFTWEAMCNLMLAYEESPTVWTDDYNLPESGNGIPDLLDEIKYELDWLLKMQNSDGSVISVIGGGGGSPPSADGDYRRYGPATTSASYTASALFALGAIQFKSLGIPAMTTYANTLEVAAENAWTWANANPEIKFFNSGVIAAGENELSTNTTNYNYAVLMRKMSAAVFLYHLTGTATYKTFVESNYTQAHLYDWSFAYPFESAEQDFLLYYTKASGITTTVGTNIKNRYSNSMVSGNADNLPAYNNNTDAYRAYLSNNNYVWGSNSVKCRQGIMHLNMNQYALSTANAANFINAASGYLHYMHGINPLAFVYLTNMGGYGAENSINEIYHSWFSEGSAQWDRVGTSVYGPPPGFVPGGANPNWSLDPCCPSGCGSTGNNALCVSLQPPGGQPHQKSYKDWNYSWPQNSWSVTENGIYYNASYIRLLSKFQSSGNCEVELSTYDRVKTNHSNGLQISVYPNPFSQHTEIEVNYAIKEPIQIRVLSVHGKELMAPVQFMTNEPIEIGHHLPEGILIVEIKKIDNTVSTLKLIKN